MSSLICPKCGRTNDKIRFIEAFCIDCYPVKVSAPPKVELEQCTRCERIKLRGEWSTASRKKIEELVVSRCKGDFLSAGYDFEGQEVDFEIRPGNTVKRTCILDVKKTICQQCSRISGGYFEGIIQLRGNRKKAEEYASRLVKKLQNTTFITKTEEKDGGIDLYVGNSKAVVAVMADLREKVFITKKLVGREQGKRLYRTTFLLRL